MIPLLRKNDSMTDEILTELLGSSKYRFHGFTRGYRRDKTYRFSFLVWSGDRRPIVHRLEFPWKALDVEMRAAYVIRTYRQTKKIGQVEFSKLMQVSQATISKWENFKLRPSLESWFRFCEKFDLSPNSIATPKGDKEETECNDSVETQQGESCAENKTSEEKIEQSDRD